MTHAHRTAALVVAFVVAGLVEAGCDREQRDVAPPRALPRATVEPVRTRVGGREAQVTCALSCEGLVGELDSLTRRCASDPLGTVRALETEPRRIAALCCTQAEEAYRRACGFDEPELDACRGRWSLECVQR